MKSVCRKGHIGRFDKSGRCIECRRDNRNKHKISQNQNRREKYQNEPEDRLKKISAARKYRIEHPAQILLESARRRCKKRGIVCAISKQDIEALIPLDRKCPVLGIKMLTAEGHISPNSMTLDRIEPKLGYIPGNVAVISQLANLLKSDQTDPEIFDKIAAWLRRVRK